MGCAYAGGALVALAKEFNLTSPRYIIAASGSAGASLYYLLGQYDELERIWKQHLSTTEFISFARLGRVMDIDYLVDTVFKKNEPLNVSELPSLHTQYYIPATEVTSRVARYFTNRDQVDVFDVLRASKALPIFYGRSVTLLDGQYVDSGLEEGLHDLVDKAKSLDPTHILIINVQVKSESFVFLKRMFKSFIIGKQQRKHSHGLTKSNLQVFTLSPKTNPASLLTRDKKKLAASFDLGYEDAKNSERLEQFLKPFSS